MNRAVAVGAAAVLCTAVGAAYFAGSIPRVNPLARAVTSSAVAAEGRATIYYQDPDGQPFYSLTPRKTSDGRAWRAVPASADVGFDEPEDPPAPAAEAKTERKITYYRNPMGLPDTSPEPKKDSMGMDYIPVYEGEDTDDGSVKLSPGRIQRTGAKSEPVVRRPVRSVIRAPGTVQEDERRVSVVALRFEGFIDSVTNVTTGDHVHKGEPLMNVYSPALSSAAAEYLSAINAGTTGKELKGARRRLENLAMPEPAIRELERTREISLSVPWLAPQDGNIVERNAVNGMRAGPGDVLFRIADHRLVWVIIDIAERDLNQVSVGARVTIRPRGASGQTFVGTVALIYPHLNAQTRTARLRVELPNPDEVLRPEMYVDAEIETGTPDPVLAVPESAVLHDGMRQVVLIDKKEGRFEPREVKLGRCGDGYIEVTEGVKEGEAVVTSANFLIDAESNLKAALKGFAEAAAPQPPATSDDANNVGEP
ncbi:MAG: efflux RND transporter periplasmic adaptor subunit [Bradyrhizobium sp.]|uniref:efflux RND transporter periplasmic adaptor subunit n=1 Tax=Bradyrhizobium sp. TaxID=376 RepID=UPI001C283BD2|nr:efflux RND transporter periplasmic adaptor subunit [Bradyrhizobium sp.]MBU6464020.1 efflux RND transporter periplasmic adaptor subunit [Pseudomonadota bacterium]MDE2069039.1 efflux RND transporter periplasmic adaptor subunit [Bradyrhizobium sp.]MDE2242643.1 efflux RND transporter periplasmic adaptor subunit [Bradyrhizobium sp.]